MNRILCVSLSLGALPALLMANDEKTRADTARRLDESATVLTELMSSPTGIDPDLLNRSHCVVIVPGVKKGAFIVGGQYGKGFVSCRSANNRGWSAPAAVRVEGGSVGFQIGGSETDVVMLVMNDSGMKRLLSDKFTLGAEGEIAAGPVGRTGTAETDAKLSAEILSWSRSRGVFAGVALKGATMRQDLDDNESLYGKRLHNREILTEATAPPAAASKLMGVLNQYSPRETPPAVRERTSSTR